MVNFLVSVEKCYKVLQYVNRNHMSKFDTQMLPSLIFFTSFCAFIFRAAVWIRVAAQTKMYNNFNFLNIQNINSLKFTSFFLSSFLFCFLFSIHVVKISTSCTIKKQTVSKLGESIENTMLLFWFFCLPCYFERRSCERFWWECLCRVLEFTNAQGLVIVDSLKFLLRNVTKSCNT